MPQKEITLAVMPTRSKGRSRAKRNNAALASEAKAVQDTARAVETAANVVARAQGARGRTRNVKRIRNPRNQFVAGYEEFDASKEHMNHFDEFFSGILKGELSVAGLIWLQSALNPCDTKTVSLGFPDMESAPVIVPSEREIIKINPTDGVILQGTFADEEVYNLIVISDPSALLTWFMIYQGNISNPSYVAIGHGFDRIRDLPASDDITSSRIVKYGTTMVFTGPTIQDQGEAQCTQLRSAWVDEITHINSSGTPPEPDSTTSIFSTWSMSTTTPRAAPNPGALEEWLVDSYQTDPCARAWKAVEGAYFIHKINEPAMLLKQKTHSIGGAEPVNRRFFVNPFWTVYNAIPEDPTTIPSTFTVPRYCDNYSWNASVFWATGISSQSSFSQKKYVQLECLIQPKSLQRFHTRQSPMYDEEALKIYNMNVRNFPSALPEVFNKTNALGRRFGGVGRNFHHRNSRNTRASRGLLHTIGSLIPGVGGITGGIGQLADDLIGNLIGGLL